ncbi:hypothetical protein [Aeromonas sp. SG16]|uniref:hypothetical protein n=1 Tax=Aeromonas sp. SG16 TaxID=2950548 RepID=UPI00210ABB0B|nr:hypothetical protein [Aeromonas sp. SG16]MCQ4055015.1 hypothetical protein [Aeromonas sp. SG16]
MIGITRFTVNPKITPIGAFNQNCSKSLFLSTKCPQSRCLTSALACWSQHHSLGHHLPNHDDRRGRITRWQGRSAQQEAVQESLSIKRIEFENPFHDLCKFTTRKVDLAHK